MGLFRSYSSKDSWITNRILGNDVTVKSTGSNHGLSPSLNVFSDDTGLPSGTLGLARSLIQFDITELSGKIYDEGVVPSSSVNYVLSMFDLVHGDTIPESFDLFVFPLSRSWDEGKGLDDDRDRDRGAVNWIQPTSTESWLVTGSDFLSVGFGSASQHFDRGSENLEVDITDIVVNWLTGAIENNGLIVKLGNVEESGTSGSYFRKAFHSRETKFIDRLPYVEARWNDVIKDNRKNFAYDAESFLYLYNFVRGELEDLSEPVTVTLRDHSVSVSSSYEQDFVAQRVSTGIYAMSASISCSASFSSSWVDIWHSGSRAYMTGTFNPLVLTSSIVDQYDEFDIAVTNLRAVYGVDEEARLIVSVRKRDYVTHRGFVTSGSLDMEREYIEKLYYSVENDETGEVVVSYGTGSVPHTQLSYNGDGNYFNICMKSFVPGFRYRLKFLIDINRYDKKIIDDNFTFKVV